MASNTSLCAGIHWRLPVCRDDSFKLMPLAGESEWKPSWHKVSSDHAVSAFMHSPPVAALAFRQTSNFRLGLYNNCVALRHADERWPPSNSRVLHVFMFLYRKTTLLYDAFTCISVSRLGSWQYYNSTHNKGREYFKAIGGKFPKIHKVF